MDKLLRKIAEYAVKSTEFIEYFPGAATERRVSLADIFVTPKLSMVKGEAVEVASLLKEKTRVILVGSPGSGKTTLLRFLTFRSAQNHLTEPRAFPAPILIPATILAGTARSQEVIQRISEHISSLLIAQIDANSLSKYLQSARVVFYVDGLDENPSSSVCQEITIALNDMAREYSAASIIIASRPSALGITFNGFRYLHLEPFDVSQVQNLAERYFHDAPDRAEEFFRAITSARSLYALSSNPLLLTLLWSIYQIQGTLPTNRARLYSDFTDYMLSTWDTARGIRRTAHVSIQDKIILLEELAIHLVEERKNTLTAEEICDIAIDHFPQMYNPMVVRQVVDEIALTGLLIEIAEKRYTFFHRTFAEYFTARAVTDDPERVVGFISERDLHEVIVMACGLMVDIAPIIEAAIDKREILLAAKCISHGRTKNRRLAEYVVTSFVHEVGQPFVRLLSEFLSKHSAEQFERVDEHAELLNRWDRAFDDHLTSQQKGILFEDFAADYFGKFFRVVYHDFNTENGEIDLVLEMTKADPFWSDFGGEALVECKNWNSNVPLKEVGAFSYKVGGTRGIKLGFFVSVSGFTDDALRTLKNQVSDPTRPLIVPINGKEIKSMLIRKDGFEDFFKEAIRGMKHLRKY